MNGERVRVVLGDDVVEDDFTSVAGANRWRIRRRIERNGDQPEEYVYTTRDGATDLHFIQDHKIGFTYILVKGPAASQIVPILTENLRHYDPADVREGARNEMSSEERRSSLYLLALMTMDRGFDGEVFEIYEKAMQHPDAIVRGAALLGSAYLGWPELAAPVRKLANVDELDESIRQDALLLAGRLEKLAAPSV